MNNAMNCVSEHFYFTRIILTLRYSNLFIVCQGLNDYDC